MRISNGHTGRKVSFRAPDKLAIFGWSYGGYAALQSSVLDPSLFKEDDVEILEDLIVAAHKDAKDKAEAITAEKTKAMTAGLPIPPGFKLPF